VNAHIEQMRLSPPSAARAARLDPSSRPVSSIYGLGDPQAYFAMCAPRARRAPRPAQAPAPPSPTSVHAQRARTFGRHLPRARRRDRHLPGRVEPGAVRSSSRRRDRGTLLVRSAHREVMRKVPRLTVYPSSHYVTPKEPHRQRDRPDREELPRAARRAPRPRQARRGAAPEQARDLRPRDDDGGRLLRRHRETTRATFRGVRRGAAPACSTTCRRDARCVDESHVTIPQLGAMYKATARARRRWSSTGSACPRRSTTGLRSMSGRRWRRRRSSSGDRPDRTRRASPARSWSRSCGRPARRSRGSRSGPSHPGGRRALRDRPLRRA